MFSFSLLAISLTFAGSSMVSACEGPCIEGTTKAFLGNYTSPVHAVLSNIAEQISTELLPPSSRPQDPMSLVEPILKAYNNESYSSLEYAIFPSYFHGKCQRFSPDGQDPPGCPNPDCPVVCGTPGSLVHFYSVLRLIVFNDTVGLMMNLTKPGSSTFNDVQKLVDDAQDMNSRRFSVRRHKTSSSVKEHDMSHAMEVDVPHTMMKNMTGSSHSYLTERSVDRLGHIHLGHAVRSPRVASSASSEKSKLEDIFSQIEPMLKEICGGDAADTPDGLPDCSWEKAMKAFILTYN